MALGSRGFGFVLGVVATSLGVSGADPSQSSASLRELTTDRPDATESPFTVDRSHVQLEMHAASFTRDNAEDIRTTEWDVVPFNLRWGVTANAELGLFFSPYLIAKEEVAGIETTRRGVGDVVLRGKLNFWGNDGGPNALGIIVDLKLPTAQDGLGNNAVEGAVTFPVAYEIGDGWEGGAMTRVEANATDRGRRPVWINTATFAHDIAPDIGGFLELSSMTGDGPHQATLNCGLSYRTDANTQLDCGVNIGLSKAAPDLGVFAGVSRRF